MREGVIPRAKWEKAEVHFQLKVKRETVGSRLFVCNSATAAVKNIVLVLAPGAVLGIIGDEGYEYETIKNLLYCFHAEWLMRFMRIRNCCYLAKFVAQQTN